MGRIETALYQMKTQAEKYNQANAQLMQKLLRSEFEEFVATMKELQLVKDRGDCTE